MKEISAAARDAEVGFFKYRDDLFSDEYWVAPKEYVEQMGRGYRSSLQPWCPDLQQDE
jgi:hypothetical protein